jgi:glutamyl-tRNA reductase
MIIGEAEIQGQVKRAYELALVDGVTGPITNRLFRDALAAGKRVRTETGIGRSRVSVSSVAVELASGILGELTSRRVLVIGAGENGELTAKALGERGVETVFVANRRYDRAIGLAQRFGGHAVRFEQLPAELAQADIVVSATASPHQIVGREELGLVMEERAGRPLLLIDIAVPRDIDPSVRELPGTTLYDMDDLQREVARNLSGREAEAARAHVIVDQEVERFGDWLASLDAVPTIAALRERGEEIVQRVLRENESRWKSLGEADRRRVEALARAVVNRLLHEPTLRIKGAAERGGSYVQLQALRELFGLESEAPELEGEQPPAAVTSLEARRRRPGH